MRSQSRSSDLGPHRSPKIGRPRRNMQGCATCRIRKKSCPGPSRDGDCESCATLRIECLRGYHQPVPPEYRTREIRGQLTKWHRERGTRQPHEALSLTQFVGSYTEEPNHLAPPYFPHHHNLSHFNPPSSTCDQPAHLPPLMYDSPTPSGSYLSEGSPPPDGPSELGDSSHALGVGGDSPAVNDTAYSPGLVDTNDPLYGADALTFQVWSPIFPWPEPGTIETGAFGGLETRDYDISDLRNASEPVAVHVPYNPTLPVILEPEAVHGSSRPAVEPYEANPSMQRTVYSLAPPRPTVAGSPNLLQPPMHTYRRRTESGPVGITPSWTVRYHQGPRVAQGEASHSLTSTRLSGLRHPEAPVNYGPHDTFEYTSD